MPVQPQYLEYILEQLAAMPALRPNRMFGGIGLYSDGLFFGLIDDDTLFFKTGENNIGDYLARRMPKFMPFPEKTKQVLGYHQVPADVIEDPEVLVAWARKAKDAALAKKAAKVGIAGKAGNAKVQTKASPPKKPRARNPARKPSTRKK